LRSFLFGPAQTAAMAKARGAASPIQRIIRRGVTAFRRADCPQVVCTQVAAGRPSA
jgi:hypothetical protein